MHSWRYLSMAFPLLLIASLGITMAAQQPQTSPFVKWQACLGSAPNTATVATLDQPVGYTVTVAYGTYSLENGSLHIGLASRSRNTNEPCKEDLMSLPIKIKPSCIQSSQILIPWDDLREALNNSLPVEEQYSMCLRTSNQWVHLGSTATAFWIPRSQPSLFDATKTSSHTHGTIHGYVPTKMSSARFTGTPKVLGIRIESGGGKSPYVNEEGVTTIQANDDAVLRLFGFHLTEGMQFKFAFALESEFNENVCDQTSSTKVFTTQEAPLSGGFSVLLPINLPDMPNPAADYYPCLRMESPGGAAAWIPVGSAPEVQLRADSRLLPVWLQIVFISILLCLSGLFSGLNLGLMALDKTELKILANTGSEKEKGYAAKVMPVRRLGNYLLCSLLLGNVLVNSSLTLLLDELTSGLVAILGSTMGIVIFGEIIPQAICSRHGLAVGAHTVWITKLFMALTFPLAFPISKILDKILGKELGSYYDRERLKELVKVTNEYNDLERDEVNMISGALDLKKKTVVEVMTKLDDVFMLSYDAVLDFGTMTEIRRNGYSRIPVYDKERPNIVSILYVKDLVLMDPDDDTPLKTLCDFYKNPCFFVYEDTNLDVIFRQFKTGDKGHLAFIQKVIDTGEKDPQYEVVGIVTLEDVIEEIIQAEIVDETDVFTDNRSKKRLRRNEERHNMTIFMPNMSTRARLSPQLALASLQYLSTSVEAFKPDYIAERIIRQLLKQDIFFQIKIPKMNNHGQDGRNLLIYERGKPEDYFVLILEGRVEVIVGNENLSFESGPFTAFGTKALGNFEKDEGKGEQANPIQLQIQPQDIEKRLKAKLPTALARIGSFKRLLSVWQMKVPFHPQPNKIRRLSRRNTSDSFGKPVEEGSLTPTNIQPVSTTPPSGTFVPDYSVKAVTDVSYIKVRSAQYAAARRATLLFHKQTQEHSTKSLNQLDRDVEKIWQDVEKASSMLPRNHSAASMRSMDEMPPSQMSNKKFVVSRVQHQQHPSSLTLDDNNVDLDQFIMDNDSINGKDDQTEEEMVQEGVNDAEDGGSLSSTDNPVVEDLEEAETHEGSGDGAQSAKKSIRGEKVMVGGSSSEKARFSRGSTANSKK